MESFIQFKHTVMQTIKFKGKKTSTGEWIYGSLVSDKNGGYAIVQITDNPIQNGEITGWCFGVIPETVGQYLGEQDLNDAGIYEGDVVDVCVFLVSPQNPDNDQHFRGWISFERGCYMLNITHYKDYSNKGELVPLQARHLPFYEPELEDDGSFVIPLYDFMGISGNLGEFISDNIEVVGNIHEQKIKTNEQQQ